MASILLTGGAGFIGSHVADALLGAGHSVVVVDNLSTGSLANKHCDVEFHQLDVRSPDLEALFASHRFDAVIHHAAQIDLRRSMREPVEDVDINVTGSLRLLSCCQRHNVPRFIFASSGGAIYGEQDCFPADESHPARPVSVYGVDKLAVERYLYVFHRHCGLNAVCLRYANVYGPRQNPLGEAGVIGIFADRMLRGESAVVNGDGRQTRDYVYVSDVAKINLLALNLTGFQVLNVGTGIETDVLTLFDRMIDLTQSRQIPAFGLPQPGEQRRSCIDNRLAAKLLGWRPEVSLDEGLHKTVEWFKAQLG